MTLTTAICPDCARGTVVNNCRRRCKCGGWVGPISKRQARAEALEAAGWHRINLSTWLEPGDNPKAPKCFYSLGAATLKQQEMETQMTDVWHGLDLEEFTLSDGTWTNEKLRDEWAQSWGFRPSSGRPCFHLVTVGRCGRQICDGLSRYRFMDHTSIWMKNGEHIAVAQPYGIGPDGIRGLAAATQEWDLDVFVDAGPSWHYPGHVVTIMLGREGWYERLRPGGSPDGD